MAAHIASGTTAFKGAGLGSPIRYAGVPTNGTSGTRVGAPVGAMLINTTTGLLYQNTGSLTSPTWSAR